MAQTTLLDIAKLNGNDAIVGLIEENLAAAPEFSVIPARTIRGTSYTTGIRTAYPSVGFRAANEGQDASKSTFIKKLIECYILGGIIKVDKAVAMAYEDGAAAWQAIEANGFMRQAMIELGSQFYYGTAVDDKGFPGLQSLVDSSLVVDAGGTTDSTASSVYAVATGSQGVQFVVGNGGDMTLSDWREETLLDSNSKEYGGLVADMAVWVGLQCVNKNAVGRLKDATADSGKGVTDAKIAELLSKFPVGNMPNILLMNRRSAYQLQVSRSVTIQAFGSQKPGGNLQIVGPMPIESNGVPIVVTDSIVSTEALS